MSRRLAALCLAVALSLPGCGAVDRFVGKVDAEQVATGYLAVSAILRDASVIAERHGLIDGPALKRAYDELNRADKMLSEGNVDLARFIYFQVRGQIPPEAVVAAETVHATTIEVELAEEAGR